MGAAQEPRFLARNQKISNRFGSPAPAGSWLGTADRREPCAAQEICEERAASGVTVTRRFFASGEQVTGTGHYFTTDHLGSIREVSDAANILLARYVFDPWGRRSVAFGSDVTTVGFTGHRWHPGGELWLTQHRQLDSGFGRWASEAPLGLEDGVNLCSYVHNSPVNYVDPAGLQATTATWPGVGKLCVDAANAAAGVLGAAIGIAVTQCGDGCVPQNTGCPPCKPPVGTVGYRLDIVPPAKPHFPYKGSHVHLYLRRQNPKTCECFWNTWMVTEPPPPIGAIPME